MHLLKKRAHPSRSQRPAYLDCRCPWLIIVRVQEHPTTAYFREQVLRKRPYLRIEWCVRAIQTPLRIATQEDGRIRHWIAIPELNGRVLRVVTLDDGLTIHNAFPDRDFVMPEEAKGLQP